MDDAIEIPEYFVCPISLQIMNDPVTAITGITYDRESIERWIFNGNNATCPVTKQPLPRDSYLTPNVTLRRLIQAWCMENSSRGIDRIPTPKSPIDAPLVADLIRDMNNPQLQLGTLRKLELLVVENERNKKVMAENGVPMAMLLHILACFKKRRTSGIIEALNILSFIRVPPTEAKVLMIEHNNQIVESLTWVLQREEFDDPSQVVAMRSHALSILKRIVESAKSSSLERLKADFIQTIVGVLRRGTTQNGLRAALHILLDSCPWGRNRSMMIECGAVTDLIELELNKPECRTTKMIFGILFHLCSCADGRAQFLSHKGGLAVLSDRIMNVSPLVDDRAVSILAMVCKYSGTSTVVQEMMMVGAVSKLCMLLQINCGQFLRDKASEILRSHSREWGKYPCSQDSMLTRHVR